MVPDQMQQNEASDQGLHCLSLIQKLLDKSAGNKTDLFKLSMVNVLKFCTPKFLTKADSDQRSSLIRVYTVCHSSTYLKIQVQNLGQKCMG